MFTAGQFSDMLTKKRIF